MSGRPRSAGTTARPAATARHDRQTQPARQMASAGQAQPAGQRPGDAVAATSQARQMLARAHWAAGAFATYDLATVLHITEAVAKAAHAESRRYAEWAVKETAFGVAEHKVIKNEACSLGVFERYRGEDFVNPRIDA